MRNNFLQSAPFSKKVPFESVLRSCARERIGFVYSHFLKLRFASPKFEAKAAGQTEAKG